MNAARVATASVSVAPACDAANLRAVAPLPWQGSTLLAQPRGARKDRELPPPRPSPHRSQPARDDRDIAPRRASDPRARDTRDGAAVQPPLVQPLSRRGRSDP